MLAAGRRGPPRICRTTCYRRAVAWRLEGGIRPMSDQLGLKTPRTASADVELVDAGRIEPTYVHVERFAPGSPESIAYLHEHGYAVIAGVLSPEECETALGLTWDYLEELGTGIDRNDWTTWGDDRWPTAV